MYRKTEERRQNLSSELRNAFVVKNKCEQLKLEKQHKSLDRLRAHESLDLMNKKREILNLQMSILASKPDDKTEEICNNKPQEAARAEVCISDTRRVKFRSRALSISASSIHSLLNSKDSRISAQNGEKMNHYKKISRSVSVSGGLDCFTRRNWATQTSTCTNNDTKTESVGSNGRTRGAVWGLLPPIQLAPLHKQKSKSVKDKSSKAHLEVPAGPARKLSADNISWNELQDCRYLRR